MIIFTLWLILSQWKVLNKDLFNCDLIKFVLVNVSSSKMSWFLTSADCIFSFSFFTFLFKIQCLQLYFKTKVAQLIVLFVVDFQLDPSPAIRLLHSFLVKFCCTSNWKKKKLVYGFSVWLHSNVSKRPEPIKDCWFRNVYWIPLLLI